MDPLPHIPSVEELNDTACLIRDTFQEKLESEVFPADVANSLRTYNVDDNLSLKDPANNVFTIQRSLEEESENIKGAESDIIKQHLEYFLSKIENEKDEYIRELMKLKPCVVFTEFYLPDKFRYGLIQKCDLFPGLTRHFLNFRLTGGSFHVCKNCLPKKNTVAPKIPHGKQLLSEVICTGTKKKREPELSGALELDPSEIVFKNFELNTVYEQTIKIKNKSSQMQGISVRSYPKSPNFTLSFESCAKIAPGMHVAGSVKMALDFYTSLCDQATFISKKGTILTLHIKCYRDPPKISAYILKSNDYPNLGNEHIPGSKEFSIRRQRAVNNTIDCGSCLVTEYVLISLVMSNKGHKAQFFWLTEEDFYFQDITGVSTNLELSKDCFWLYPTYFGMNHEDICDISILFQPLQCGFNTQTLFLMCDNNTYVQIEIVGDGICFNKNMISVGIPDRVNEIERKKEGHRIFLGYVKHKEKTSFTFSILNRSPIFLKYTLKCGLPETARNMWDWIRVVNGETYLAPYSTTDLTLELTCPGDVPRGYHNTKLRLFVEDIPIASLEAGETFLVDTNGQDLKDITENLSAVDVLIMEVELACFVEPLIEARAEIFTECAGCGNIDCQCTFCAATVPIAELEFDTSFLEFGLLPLGADVRKEFAIENLGKKALTWSIVELKYNVDFQPHIEAVKQNNLSINYGTLEPDKTQSISYMIARKDPERYVSILVLFSIRDRTDERSFIAESICVVTYEIVELNIQVKTEHSAEPILCPMKMLYTGVPIKLSFKLKNRSLIPGCFYFLKPTGSEADKVDVEYRPQSGELKAGSTKKIHLTLKCYEVGILENVFLPCFIGNRQEPLQIRLLCVVDCVHVFFYLPIKNNEFQKVLWPPKVIYEYDWNWSDYCLCEELQNECENTINSVQSENAEQMNKRSEETLNDIKCSRVSLDKHTEANSDDDGSQNILKTLVNVDSEIFLQECVMEVKRVKIKEPTKVTIYFENVTPKAAKYAVQSTNFAAKENNIKACLGPKYKKTEDFWEPMLENYGILVHPEIETNYMRGHELITVDIWIYAKTWGVYVEEIIVDIENIASFSFSVIIEAVGCPLQLPLGVGAITQYPTIRFGSVAYESDDVERNVTIRNTSSVDLTVLWHVFYSREGNRAGPFNVICDAVGKSGEQLFELNFTDRFFGVEAFECVEVEPSKLEIGRGKNLPLSVIFRPRLVKTNNYSDKFPIQCFILGRIFPKEPDRLKSSYFYRKPSSLVIEVNATLEMPNLEVEIEEDYALRIYANDVAIKRQNEYAIKCIIRNPTSLTINAVLDCLEPFSFEKIDPKLVLGPGKCRELYLPCVFSYEKILKWAPYAYRLTEIKEAPSASISTALSEVKLSVSGDKIVDDDDKRIVFRKKLFVYYQGGFKSVVPIDIHIYYPHIAVKPLHVKFGYVLLGNTAKAVVHVYNLTGCVVMFEIYKSTSTQELVVTPPNGEIAKSTGANNSFTKITVYFTPTECKTYHESIRVMTNIPQYFIDIPIKGSGSFNEKFLNL